jgi:hypothetical protein
MLARGMMQLPLVPLDLLYIPIDLLLVGVDVPVILANVPAVLLDMPSVAVHLLQVLLNPLLVSGGIAGVGLQILEGGMDIAAVLPDLLLV